MADHECETVDPRGRAVGAEGSETASETDRETVHVDPLGMTLDGSLWTVLGRLSGVWERLAGEADAEAARMGRYGAPSAAPVVRRQARAETLRTARAQLVAALADFRSDRMRDDAFVGEGARFWAETRFLYAAECEEARDRARRTGAEVSPPVVRWQTRADTWRLCAADVLRITAIFDEAAA